MRGFFFRRMFGVTFVLLDLVPDLASQLAGALSGQSPEKASYWWPTPGSGTLSDAVPAAVADAYREGARCLSAGAPNGTSAMLRTAMTWIVDDKGSSEAKAKGDLKERSSRWWPTGD